MHIVDPVRFLVFLFILSIIFSPMCGGWIGCEEYPEGYWDKAGECINE